jgi:hypothetical protein
MIMNKLAASLAVGVATLFVGSAQAAPLMPTAPVVDNGIENVRLVCDQWGRCWRERGYRRAYGYYAPDYGYRRPYYRQPGVYFGAPGIGLGFGFGGGYGHHRRW